MAVRSLAVAFKITAWLFLLLVVLCLAGAGFLHFRPDALREPVERAVTAALPGGRFSVRLIRPSLWPSPGVRLEDCYLSSSNGDAMLAEGLECHLSWGAFLNGDLMPALVILDQPAVRVAERAASSEAARTPAQPQSDITSFLNKLKGVSVQVRNGSFALYPKGTKLSGDGASLPSALLELEKVTGTASLPYLGRTGALDVKIGGLRQRLSGTDGLFLPSEVRDFVIRADGVAPDEAAPYGVRVAKADVSLKGRVDGLLNDTRLKLTLAQPREKIQNGTLTVEGNLHLPLANSETKRGARASCAEKQNPLAPFRLHLPFAVGENRFAIADGLVELENDSARVSLNFGPEGGLKGRADVTRFSLPRWFAFARKLPGGLAVALDKLSGGFTFAIDGNGLNVPMLRANVAGTELSGSASYRPSANPALRIDVAAGRADVNRILPELLGRDILPPVFAGPPPALGKNDGPDLTYAVNIRAESARFWNLECGGLDVAIAPAPDAKNVTRLAFQLASFYEGSARQIVDLGKVCALRTELSGVNLQKLSGMFSRTVPMEGTLSGKASFTGPAGSLAQLVGGLEGETNAEIRDGRIVLKNGGKAVPFTRLKLVFSGRGITPFDAALPPLLAWDGAWKVAAHLPVSELVPSPTEATLDLKGPIAFSSTTGLPQEMKSLPMRCSGTVLGGGTALTGELSFLASNGSFELNNLAGTLAGCTLKGRVAAANLNTAAPSWSLHGQVSTQSLRAVLENLNVSLPKMKENTLRKLSLSVDADVTPKETRILNLKARLDDTSLSGSLTSKNGEIPHWDADLALGTLNLDRYLPVKSHPRANSAAEGKAGGNSPGAQSQDLVPLPVESLKTFTLKAMLKADALTISDVPLQKASFPVTVEKGVLAVDSARAICCGGKADASMSMKAHKESGAETALHLKLAGVDLDRLTAAVSPDTLMTGKFDFQTRLAGHPRYFNEFLLTLSGGWRLAIGGGTFVSVNPKTRHKSAPYHILSTTASGTLANGLVTCNDLMLNGRGFFVRGRGTVNLKEDTINYTLNATTPTVPDIPITYSGKLSDPTRNVKALTVLTGVLSEVGKGVFSIVGNVIKAPFQLLR